MPKMPPSVTLATTCFGELKDLDKWIAVLIQQSHCIYDIYTQHYTKKDTIKLHELRRLNCSAVITSGEDDPHVQEATRADRPCY